VGVTLGYNGIGGRMAVLLPPVGLWISGGYLPTLVFGSKSDAARPLTLDVYSTAQVNVDLSVTLLRIGPRLDGGLVSGYRYNTLLGHGEGGGITVTYDLSGRLALFWSAEAAVFPRAQARLDEAGYPSDRTAALPWLQWGANVGLLLFP
jgi:hypothetical protein